MGEDGFGRTIMDSSSKGSGKFALNMAAPCADWRKRCFAAAAGDRLKHGPFIVL